MSDKDPIIDLFESKLKNAEFEVDPSVWTNIASQIPATSVASVSSGLTLGSKLIIAASVITTAIITTVALYTYNDTEETEVQATPVISEKSNTDTEESAVFEKIEEPTPLDEEVTDQVELSNSSEPYTEEEIELTNQNLTILSVDQIIDQEQLAAEDNLMEQFIDTPIKQTDDKEAIELEEEEEQVEIVSEQEETVETSIEIKIPNVFTPNNDGQNDTYHLTFEGVINDVAVVIFNQKGDVVFRSSRADFQWDGMDLRGEPCPSGRYLFMMTGQDEFGNEVLKSRDFQLLR